MTENDLPRPWEIRERRLESRFRIFDVEVHHSISPRTGREHEFTVIEAPNWVNVIARTQSRDIVFVQQYRPGTREITLEIPGGMVDPGESPAEAAARELLEETGYAGRAPVEIGVVEPNPAIQSNRCFTYFVDECEQISEPQLDGSEDIAVSTLPEAEIHDAVVRGDIGHALVIAAFYWWKLRETVERPG